MNRDALLDDIPVQTARNAHAWSSMTPEVRGEQSRADYADTLAADYANLATLATTDDKRATLAEEFARYRAGYRTRYLAMLAARSRCASTMVTGRSGFNVRRAEKANAVDQKRTTEVIEYRKRALVAIKRALCPEDQPIRSGDSDAVERLRTKLEACERAQEQMKAANAAIRKHAKAGADAQIAALVALGISVRIARTILEPDYMGRIGFADYQLKNNNAEIRRLKARIEAVSAAHATPTAEAEGEHARLEDNAAENRVRLFFPGKPDAEIRARLGRNGFRWTRSLKCWQAYRNHHSLAIAREIAGVEVEAAAAQ